ncbi:aldose 1-epimerase [Conexibacter sp. CPCC 206217]|uniref:aldose 1-epimerase n=1 Tax=Conexibacter sp. CPCC 206217 TaxID=3064574 RepID=UPI002722129A|nr:aldose 1-epimerase [Conexibacter sp. CPCC 206217]MDO8210377.1 aldose 1-epimerase [Conexibacter sp. CPCC 206217]
MIETTQVEGFEALRLSSEEGLTATFLPGAGMLGVSLRDGEQELLGQRHGLATYLRDARTMALPLLHPWANRLSRDAFEVAGQQVRIADGAAGLHRDGNGLPMHGLLAGRPEWIVERDGTAGGEAADAGGAAFGATFDYGAHPELLASFPFPHMLRIEVALHARTLRLTTTLTATGDVPVPVAYGFHPYLRLPDTPRERWQVELPALRHLQLDARSIPTGAAEQEPASVHLLGDRAFDDAYDGVEPGTRFAVGDGTRRIELRFEQGFAAAQVFAPLSEPVVCFEPMTAPTDALVSGNGLRLVEPGERDVSAFSLTVA